MSDSRIHYYSLRFGSDETDYEDRLKEICRELKINYSPRYFHKSGKTVWEIACTPQEYDILIAKMFKNETL